MSTFDYREDIEPDSGSNLLGIVLSIAWNLRTMRILHGEIQGPIHLMDCLRPKKVLDAVRCGMGILNPLAHFRGQKRFEEPVRSD